MDHICDMSICSGFGVCQVQSPVLEHLLVSGICRVQPLLREHLLWKFGICHEQPLLREHLLCVGICHVDCMSVCSAGGICRAQRLFFGHLPWC